MSFEKYKAPSTTHWEKVENIVLLSFKEIQEIGQALYFCGSLDRNLQTIQKHYSAYNKTKKSDGNVEKI